jgi:hypothetical protein
VVRIGFAARPSLTSCQNDGLTPLHAFRSL